MQNRLNKNQADESETSDTVKAVKLGLYLDVRSAVPLLSVSATVHHKSGALAR
jgi:hypothetical protein